MSVRSVLLLLSLLILVPHRSSAAPLGSSDVKPHIERSLPTRLVAVRHPRGFVELALQGSGFATERVTVSVRAGTGSSSPVTVVQSSPTLLKLRLPQAPYLAKPGDLEFTVSAAGQAPVTCRVKVLPYPTEKPVIESLITAIPLSRSSSLSPMRTQRLTVRHLTPDAYVTIQGKLCQIERLLPGDGFLEVRIPPAVQATAGRYPIVVTTSVGSSESAHFDIIAPPVIRAFKPTFLHVSPDSARTPHVTVTVYHEGTVTPTASVRLNTAENREEWHLVELVELKAGVAILVLPHRWVSQEGVLQVRLTNIGGESVGYLPVDTRAPEERATAGQ